ncbi:unnamed protein product [Brassica oleracea]
MHSRRDFFHQPPRRLPYLRRLQVTSLSRRDAESNAAWEKFLPFDPRLVVDHSLSRLSNNHLFLRSVNPLFSSMMAERFEEVAALLMVCWFEIRGNISSSMLSKGTVYGAYLVFKEGEIGAFGFRSQPLETSFRYILRSTRTGLCNDRRAFLESGMPEDGWLEIELGEYYVGFDEEELVMSVLETREGGWKGGIIVQEIEIRPKGKKKFCVIQ